eukprot:1192143-Prorocentrum_minimum.AAC.1
MATKYRLGSHTAIACLQSCNEGSGAFHACARARASTLQAVAIRIILPTWYFIYFIYRYSLPSRDWSPRQAYSLSPRVTGPPGRIERT